MKIHYIAQYTDEHSAEGRKYIFSPGGTSKMHYLLSCLKDLGYDVKIYSLCPRKGCLLSFGHKGVNCLGVRVLYASTLNISSPYSAFIRNIWFQVQLFFYLLFVPRHDIIYFYHERFYSPVIDIIRKIRNLCFICDIEEIYTVHAGYDRKVIDKEIKYLRSFSKYTVATESLIQKLNLSVQNSVVCNGAYGPQLHRAKTPKNTINVLYSGTFDPIKGGVYAAIQTFDYLPENYCLFVCGFGNEQDIDNVRKMCSEINASHKTERIFYKGFIPGNSQEYKDILEICDIGLALQNPRGEYNDTSFPSKILEYMRYGLIVVSSDIPVVRNSDVGKYIEYAIEYSPEKIAESIRGASLIQQKEVSDILATIENRFKERLRKIISQ